jgi:hypothetical protein
LLTVLLGGSYAVVVLGLGQLLGRRSDQSVMYMVKEHLRANVIIEPEGGAHIPMDQQPGSGQQRCAGDT